MEALELAALMVLICCINTVLYSSSSPLHKLSLTFTERSILMGVGVALGSFVITYSSFGRRSGAHLNPAITLTYYSIGVMQRWDALFYVVAQIGGGVLGVYLAHSFLGSSLSEAPVRYVVTLPGHSGFVLAFISECGLAALLMSLILFSSNHRTLSRFTPLIAAIIGITYSLFCSSISGYSINPARSLSSALFAEIWDGLWIFLIAPCIGMAIAGAAYVRAFGRDRVYCAKMYHDLSSPCPFDCRFDELAKS